MMTQLYKVLWIDDEHEDLLHIKDEAADNGIELVAFKSVEKGLPYLRQNLASFDVVLLDAKSFLAENQGKNTGSLAALAEACSQIDQLASHKVFEKFVFSGQKGFVATDEFRQLYPNFYDKTAPDDAPRLFTDLRAAASRQAHTQIRQRYADAFTACKAIGLGDSADRKLLEVLEVHEGRLGARDHDSSLNVLRQLTEAFLYATQRHHLLPKQCLKNNGEVNFTFSGIFFSGKPVNPPQGGEGVKPRGPILPAVLSDSLWRLIELTNNGSHYQQDSSIPIEQREVTKKKLQELRRHVQTPYLLSSLIYQLLDLLIWLAQILGNQSELIQLQNAWDPIPINNISSSEVLSGTVKTVLPRGNGFFRSDDGKVEAYIPEELISASSLTTQLRISVTLGPSPNGKLPTVQKIVRADSTQKP